METDDYSKTKEQLVKELLELREKIDSLEKDRISRRSMEEDLSREKYFSEMVINSLPGIFYLVDDEGNFHKWNKSAEIITGYSPEEIKGMKTVDVFEGEDKKLIAEKSREVFDKGEAYAEADLVSKNGRKTRYYFSGHRLIIDDRPYIVGMSIDISELKKAEEKIRLSEEKYHGLVDALQEGIWAIDKDDKTTFVNEPMTDILGYSADEMLGKSVFSFMDDRGIELCKYFIERRKQGIREQHDFELIKKDESRVYVTMEASPMYDENGDYIGGVTGVIDITDRKKAEETLQKYTSLLSSLVESPADVIILSVDRDYNYTFFNTAHKKEMKKVWGVDIETGRNLLEYIPTEEEREKVRGNFERVLSGEHFTKTEWYGEQKNRFWYELAYNPIYDESNNVNGITVFITDITERKRTTEALKDSEEKFRLLSESSLAGIFIIQDLIFRYINPSASRTFGFRANEVIDKLGPLDLTHPDDHPASLKYIEQCLTNKADITPFTFRGLTRNGDIINCEVLARRIDYKGRLAMLGTLIDITERKKAEDALTQEKRRLEHITSFVNCGILLLDDQTGIIYTNRVLEEKSGSDLFIGSKGKNAMKFLA
jgi:PAS domain S-box-containing protein